MPRSTSPFVIDENEASFRLRTNISAAPYAFQSLCTNPELSVRAASRSVTASNGSYCTMIESTARCAISADVAATAASTSPS
jgi:hypothetical protein